MTAIFQLVLQHFSKVLPTPANNISPIFSIFISLTSFYHIIMLARTSQVALNEAGDEGRHHSLALNQHDFLLRLIFYVILQS